jgi:hypothetical protein
MNIKEALEWSKANGGRQVSRKTPVHGTVGWISWDTEAFVYKLTFEDLTADDWESTAENISRITNGRWYLLEKATLEKRETHCMRDPSPIGACAGPGKCSCECNTCLCPNCMENPCECPPYEDNE